MKKSFHYAILFALINAFLLAVMGLFAKLLAHYMGPIEVTFFRNFVSLVLIVIVLAATGTLATLKTKRPFAHLIRGFFGTVGIILGMWSLAMMPLSLTTVLLFTSPLWTVLLSYPVLGEKVGIFRLSAVLFGFLGVVIIANPLGNPEAAIPLLGLVAGLGWGFFSGAVDICLRWMGKTEHSNATVFYFMVLGSVSTAFHLPFAEFHPQSFSPPALWIILGLALSGVLGLFAKTQSYRLGEASIIAPIMYSMIIWTMLFDYLFWNKIPTINVIAGALIIIISNLVILYREAKLHKKISEINED